MFILWIYFLMDIYSLDIFPGRYLFIGLISWRIFILWIHFVVDICSLDTFIGRYLFFVYISWWIFILCIHFLEDIYSSSLFNNFKKPDSENVPSQIHDFERRLFTQT